MERIVIRPDFKYQLSKKSVDKRAEDMKKDAEERIAQLKLSRLCKTSIESRAEEIKKGLDNRLAYLYINFYNARLNIAKGNIATFYSHLYGALFGVEALRPFKTEKEEYQNGATVEQRNFHPDHIRYEGRRKIFCEIKAISRKNSKPWCASKQLENYCHDLLTDAFDTMFPPELEYAFFKYQRRGNEEKKTSTLTNKELARRLTKNTESLLIVPSNLLFLMLYSSNSGMINQESNKGPDECHYWKIYGGLISRLGREDNPVMHIARELRAEKEFEWNLCLEDIGVTRTQSPEQIYCGDMSVKPFQITRYFNRTGKWLDYFKKNHKSIITQMLGIRDLYEELGGVPF